MKSLFALSLLATLSACAAQAPEPKAEAPLNAAQKAYTGAAEKMHHDMTAIPADADVAFMQGMIAHHQGAVDMAKIVLEHGKDAKTQAMAATIIETQTAEIAEMDAWLKARDVEPIAADHAAMGH